MNRHGFVASSMTRKEVGSTCGRRFGIWWILCIMLPLVFSGVSYAEIKSIEMYASWSDQYAVADNWDQYPETSNSVHVWGYADGLPTDELISVVVTDGAGETHGPSNPRFAFADGGFCICGDCTYGADPIPTGPYTITVYAGGSFHDTVTTRPVQPSPGLPSLIYPAPGSTISDTTPDVAFELPDSSFGWALELITAHSDTYNDILVGNFDPCYDMSGVSIVLDGDCMSEIGPIPGPFTPGERVWWFLRTWRIDHHYWDGGTEIKVATCVDKLEEFYVANGTTVPHSPYPSRDEWDGWYPHPGQLHAHREWDSEHSIDNGSDRDLLTTYRDARYDFLAITEHQLSLNEKFNDQTWPQVFVDPGVDGIVSMVGSIEDTGDHHILGVGFGEGVNRGWMGEAAGEAARIWNITGRGGLAFMAHPDDMVYG